MTNYDFVRVRRTWDRDGKTSYALTAVSFDFYGLLVARQQLRISSLDGERLGVTELIPPKGIR